MTVVLRAVDEDEPGDRWRAFFEASRESYARWFLKEGDHARPSYRESSRALRRHMPELKHVYEALVELAGAGDLAARLLTLYCPTPYLAGCSQAVWTRDTPFLVRNYDYSPNLWDALLLRSRWLGRPVIGMSDSLWGILDGINDAGVVVSLAFGGRRDVGEGFAMPLILRYVLETCGTTADACAVLSRVPSHMAYTVTMLDADGSYATVFTGPGREAVVLKRRYATNHQGSIEWPRYAAATASEARERTLMNRLEDEHETAARFVARFLEPPLFSTRFDHGWGTLYTASYDSVARAAGFRWPTFHFTQSIDRFSELAVQISYPTTSAAGLPVAAVGGGD